MHKISVFYIQKKLDASELCAHFAKLIRPHAQLCERNIFTKALAASDATAARAATTQAYLPHLAAGYNIALAEDGQMLDSQGFARLLQRASERAQVSFFIGGAYGLEEAFKRRCDSVLSLSRMTTSHHIARAFLLEQIYRACTILSAHPYHK